MKDVRKLVLLGVGAFILMLIVAFNLEFISRKNSSGEPIRKQSNNLIQSPAPTSYDETNGSLTVTLTPTPKFTIETDSTKRELENSLGLEWTIELFTASPSDSNIIAFTAYPENFSGYGIYLYNRATGKSNRIWFLDKSIYGRGAYYADNLDMEFSPSGAAFFLNKTGTNVPSMFVIDSSGSILYQTERDLGHPTWLSGNTLLFLSGQFENPASFDVASKRVTETSLPQLMHFESNLSGNVILAYRLPSSDNVSSCNEFTLEVYGYPSLQIHKSIPKVYLKSAKWVTNDIFNYQKVLGCKEGDYRPEPILSNIIQDSIY